MDRPGVLREGVDGGGVHVRDWRYRIGHPAEIMYAALCDRHQVSLHIPLREPPWTPATMKCMTSPAPPFSVALPHERDVAYRNWSGSVRFTAALRVCPRTEEEVAEIVRKAAEHRHTVRPVGSGHSSTPLMKSDDVLLSLDELSGVVSHDADAGLATVLPGTGLASLGKQLADVGLALQNLGDVDYQAIAGAVGTGTHGTGESLGNLSSFLVGGRLVTGTGEIVPFGVDAGESADPESLSDLTRAAQVSLGALGVLTSLTFAVRPAHHLHRRNVMTRIDWALEHFDELARSYRHVDLYWYPRSDRAQIRVVDEPGRLDDLADPGQVKTEERGPSYEILPNHREIRFDEMEYMLPRESGWDVFGEVRTRVKARHRSEVAWRVLLRTIAPDRAMLSNAQGRPTMTIALLHNADLPYEEYFGDLEPVFLDAGGRPHWGKKHGQTHASLQGMYPDWDRFRSLRQRLDPAGVFLNDYLKDLLGEGGRTDD